MTSETWWAWKVGDQFLSIEYSEEFGWKGYVVCLAETWDATFRPSEEEAQQLREVAMLSRISGVSNLTKARLVKLKVTLEEVE